MLQMAIPVREHVGPALGVVVVNVDLNGLFRLLAADLPEDYQLYLANGAGDILIHPEASRAFAFDRGQRALLQDEFAEVSPLLRGDRANAVIDAPEGERPAQIAAFVAQNIQTADFGDPVFDPYVLRELNGVPVAIIGQAFPYTPIAHPAACPSSR